MSRILGIISVILSTSQLLASAASNESMCENNVVKVQKLPDGVPFKCQPLPSSNDRDDYELFPDVGYYKFHTEALSWNAARKKCIEEGAHLAIVNNKVEAKVMGKLFKEFYEQIRGTDNDHLAWLGVHDQFEEGDFVTVLGDSFKATDDVWEKGYARNVRARIKPATCRPAHKDTAFGRQPDNGGPTGNQDCAALIRECDTLEDNNCTRSYAFFCEKPVCS